MGHLGKAFRRQRSAISGAFVALSANSMRYIRCPVGARVALCCYACYFARQCQDQWYRIRSSGTGGGVAGRIVPRTSDELCGLVAQGQTVAEALDIAYDVARKLIEARRDRDGSAPLPEAASPLNANTPLLWLPEVARSPDTATVKSSGNKRWEASVLTARPLAATKFGSTRRQMVIPAFPTIPAT